MNIYLPFVQIQVENAIEIAWNPTSDLSIVSEFVVNVTFVVVMVPEFQPFNNLMEGHFFSLDFRQLAAAHVSTVPVACPETKRREAFPTA